MRILVMTAGALVVAACGGEAPKAEKVAPPKTFPTGEWEVTATVDRLISKDGTTPAVKAKQGDAVTRKACVTDPRELAALFVAEGDDCTAQTAFARGGNVNSAYTCKRPGQRGTINPTVYGKYTADTLAITVNTGTQLSGDGDYELTEKLTGKRLGDCPAGSAAAGNAAG